MREEHIQPPTDRWESVKEKMIEEQIHIICKDILKKRNTTEHQDIYDALYEIVEGNIEVEHAERP